MACPDCLQNCDPRITDRCTEVTQDIPLLGIENGDTLFEFETKLVELLETLVDGTGTTLSELTLDCDLITNLLGNQDKTVANLIQVLVQANCELQASVTELQEIIDTTFSFNTSCLTGELSTRDQILQAVILKTCNVDSRVTAIEADYVKASELCDQVSLCLANSASTQYNARMVPGIVYPYIGSLSNFDNTGKGFAAMGFDKIYLVNGLNGTRDWRGRSPIGAIANVPGGTLDSAVDPTLSANAGLNYALHQKVGASSVTLTVQQIPGHTHGVNDPGHTHLYTSADGASGTNGSGVIFKTPNSVTSTSLTGITIASTGGNLPHINIQPSIGSYYITYIP